MRDAVLVLVAVGVAYVIYKMSQGNDAGAKPLGELAEVSDAAKQLALDSDVVGQFGLSTLSSSASLIRPRVTFEERVNIASSGDSSIAGGLTGSAADL